MTNSITRRLALVATSAFMCMPLLAGCSSEDAAGVTVVNLEGCEVIIETGVVEDLDAAPNSMLSVRGRVMVDALCDHSLLLNITEDTFNVGVAGLDDAALPLAPGAVEEVCMDVLVGPGIEPGPVFSGGCDLAADGIESVDFLRIRGAIITGDPLYEPCVDRRIGMP